MLTRTVTFIVALSLLSSGDLFSQQPTVFSGQKHSGVIILKLSGDLAKEYAQITRPIDGDGIPGNQSITINAVIAERSANDQVRIEHSVSVKREGKPDRLVTLTATVDEKEIRSLVRTVFDGDFTFSNSSRKETAAESPTVTAHHFAVPFLSLTEFNGIELQTWTVESEISE